MFVIKNYKVMTTYLLQLIQSTEKLIQITAFTYKTVVA